MCAKILSIDKILCNFEFFLCMNDRKIRFTQFANRILMYISDSITSGLFQTKFERAQILHKTRVCELSRGKY